MTEIEQYQRQVVTLKDTSSVFDVAAAMEHDAVGCVVIVDAERCPLGIVTDRDLAVRVIASERDAGNTLASAVMSHPAISVETGDSIPRAIEKMCRHGVRRIPIVKDGAVVGIVALDDLLAELGSELDDLGGIVRRQIFEARLATTLPRLREELETRLHEMRERVQQAGGRASEVLGREFESLRERVRRTLQ
jgi:signal-transduction protein with cAMP-binding, CBS, and nucleotidyltransferase domain